ncbi:MAG: tandem-95 repeat protein, partial [Sterolibacterium sp.]|nr:tandem-95 repeat protein [Sterolibacterium sp.]
TVTDGEKEDEAQVTVSVGAANDAPEAQPDANSTDEDTTLVVNAANGVIQNLAGQDSDPNGDSLSVSEITFGTTVGKVGQPIEGAWGTLTLGVDGSYTYVPNANAQTLKDGQSVADVFNYTVKDPAGLTASTTLTITVTGINDAPQVADERVVTGKDASITIPVLDNDSDPEGDPLQIIEIDGQPVSGAPGTSIPVDNGTVTLTPEGEVIFTPDSGYEGPVTFEYTVSDGSKTAEGKVTVIVSDVNNPPVARDDRVVGLEDSPLNFDPRSNDGDRDGDLLTITEINGEPIDKDRPYTLPGQGVITINSNGKLTFTPEPDYNGTFEFDYTISDGRGEEARATVQVVIQPVNDPPLAPPVSVNTAYQVPVTDRVTGTDVDGDELTYTVTAGPDKGTVIIDPETGVFTYTPHPGATGQDTFFVTVADGQGGEVVTTVTVTIGEASIPPEQLVQEPFRPIEPPVLTPLNPLDNSPVMLDAGPYFAGERFNDVRRMDLPFHPIVYVNREVTHSQALRAQDDPRGFSDPAAVEQNLAGPRSLGMNLGVDRNLFVIHAIRDSQQTASFLQNTVQGRYSRLGLGGDDLLAQPGLFRNQHIEVSELLELQRKKLKKSASEASANADNAEQDATEQDAAEQKVEPTARQALPAERSAQSAPQRLAGGASPSFSEQLRKGAARLPMAPRKV